MTNPNMSKEEHLYWEEKAEEEFRTCKCGGDMTYGIMIGAANHFIDYHWRCPDCGRCEVK